MFTLARLIDIYIDPPAVTHQAFDNLSNGISGPDIMFLLLASTVLFFIAYLAIIKIRNIKRNISG